MEGNLDQVKILLHKDANIQSRDQDGDSPLHLAALYGHTEVIQYLISQSADIHSRGHHGRTPLMMAAENCKGEEIIPLLIAAKARVNDRDTERESTALHISCRYGTVGAVKELLQGGGDVHMSDRFGVLPIHKAAVDGSVPKLEALIMHGARANVTDQLGYTPLMAACWYGHVEAAEYLLTSHDAAVDQKVYWGGTTLHLAS